MKRGLFIGGALAAAGLLPLLAAAAVIGAPQDASKTGTPDKSDKQAAEFFETKVRPLLIADCYMCHGPTQQSGGLRLDSREALLKGGADGMVVKPGAPEASRLVQAIHYAGALKMPPAGKLSDDKIAILTAWVKMGAPWPSYAPGEGAPSSAARHPSLWSLQPVKRPAIPKVQDRAWCANPIDDFVLAKLEQKGLRPAPRADRRTLIRRAYYDLVGLPPTAGQVAAFLADKSPMPQAWAKVVDRLLASPQYGERWGRHWLDVARYADTKGYVFVDDRVYHNAYTYRDWVVRAFNEDLPYNQFIVDQLAADRLPQVQSGADPSPLAALGFLTVGRRFLNNQPDIIDDRIDVTCRGFLGLTVNCARCHDHKFDPIPQADYYSLYGVFASSREPDPPLPISPKSISAPYEAQNVKIVGETHEREQTIRNQIAMLRATVRSAPDKVPADVKQVLQSIREGALPDERQLAKLGPHFDAAAWELIQALEKQIADQRRHMPPAPEFAMAMVDLPQPVTQHVFLRGNPHNEGPEVPRQFLSCLSDGPRKSFTGGSGRLELAEAIASPSNPLTARVFVNRVWRWHFGQGIVRTPSDFGTRGDLPTHPELLDWLASEFASPNPPALTPAPHSLATLAGKGEPERTRGPVPPSLAKRGTSGADRGRGEGQGVRSDAYAMGWSIKKLHKLILMSSTYQQASDTNPHGFAADPENKLVWHMNRQRLDLEALRDSLLFVAGRLEEKIGGPAVELTTQPFTTRRTVYGFIDRQNLQGLYRTFDFATPDATSAGRYTTTIPQQALFMMNSPFVVEQAQYVAKRPELTACTNDADRIRAAYRVIFARSPNAEEVALGLAYLKQAAQAHIALASTASAQTGGSKLSPWDRYIQALLMTNEFAFVD